MLGHLMQVDYTQAKGICDPSGSAKFEIYNGLGYNPRKVRLTNAETGALLGSIFQDALHAAQDHEPRAQFTLQANRRDATTLPKLRVPRTIRRQNDE